MLNNKELEFPLIVASMLLTCVSYLLVVWKDKSWINWATPLFILSLGSRYVFPLAYLVTVRSTEGSRYAYSFCYATYVLSSFAASLSYAFLKPIKIKPSTTQAKKRNFGLIAWTLLALGFLFYMPILIEFRAYLAEPRRIYELTRSGYGIYFFTSTFLATIGFVAYLFHKPKHLLGIICYYGLIAALTFWHGSKGQILNYFLIWMLYRVYVDGKRVRALTAAAIAAAVVVAIIGSFVLFSSAADIYEVSNGLVAYADGVRHAMIVIDDSGAEYSFGRLMLEKEVYNRIPRVLMPDKPKDFGGFALAKRYSPSEYRADEGSPNYDMGETYADFGPFSIIYLCTSAVFMAWLVSSFAADLRLNPSPARFLVFMFLAGVNVIPISGVFYLPETLLVAGALSFALKFRIIRGISWGHPRQTPA